MSKLTSREKNALSRIKQMYSLGFSLDKIKRKLEPRFSASERKKAIEEFLFNK